LPAGNNINPTGKESLVVPGASTTALVPVHHQHDATITLEPTPFPTIPARAITVVTVLEGDDGEISVPAFGAGEGENTVTVTESTPAPTNSVTVTGGHVERQMLPITSSVIAARQMLPPPRPKLGQLDERQMLPITSTVIGARQMLPPPKPKLGQLEADAQVTYLPKPPVSPGGGRPAEEVEARQMLPITSSVIGARQMLPISSVTPEVNARQMLPISSTPGVGGLIQQKVHTPPGPPFGGHPNPKVDAPQPLPTSVTKRQMLPISSTPGVSARQMLPISSTPGVSARQMLPISSTPGVDELMQQKTYTSPGTPFGQQPDPKFDAPQALPTSIEASVDDVPPCVGGCATNTNPIHTRERAVMNVPEPTVSITSSGPQDSADGLPTSCVGGCAVNPVPTRERAITTVTSTSLHTVTSTPLSTSESSTVIVGTVVPEPSTVTVTSTVYRPTYAPNDNGTTVTALVSQAPAPWTNETWTITVRPATIVSVDTCTESSTSSTSSETTTQVTVTTHITTTLTGTGTKDVGPPRLTPPAFTKRDQDPTFSFEPPVARQATVDQGPPRLTPPAITARDQDPTFSFEPPVARQATVDVGPPRLTPPVITRRDDGPPEAGPLEPKPPFGAEPTTLVTSVVRSAA
jgi:hypothetical protein